MKVIVGLGNPGAQYARTRHNAGFMVVDAALARFGTGEVPKARFQGIASEVTIAGEKCLFLKPTVFMNRSGQSVAEAARFYKVDLSQELLVVVDDIYLPTGTVRIRPGGGTGGHNGLESVEALLGGDMYPRLRIGAGEQPNGGSPSFIDQADYVLSRFRDDEAPLLDAAIKKGVEAVEVFAARGLAHAMNFANAGPAPPREKRPAPEPGAPPMPNPRPTPPPS